MNDNVLGEGHPPKDPMSALGEVFQRINQWQAARPRLRIGGCPYGQSLLLKAIYLCEEGIRQNYDSRKLRLWIKALHDKLNTLPPTTPSAPSAASNLGPLLFITNRLLYKQRLGRFIFTPILN